MASNNTAGRLGTCTVAAALRNVLIEIAATPATCRPKWRWTGIAIWSHAEEVTGAAGIAVGETGMDAIKTGVQIRAADVGGEVEVVAEVAVVAVVVEVAPTVLVSDRGLREIAAATGNNLRQESVNQDSSQHQPIKWKTSRTKRRPRRRCSCVYSPEI